MFPLRLPSAAPAAWKRRWLPQRRKAGSRGRARGAPRGPQAARTDAGVPARSLAAQLNIDPASVVRALRVPLMIVGGGSDLQINRTDSDALCLAAPSAPSRWLNDINHVLKSRECTPAELLVLAEKVYGEPRPVHPELLRKLTSFLNGFATRAAPAPR